MRKWKWKNSYLFVFAALLSSFLFIFIPYRIWKKDNEKINESDLTQLTGNIYSIEKTLANPSKHQTPVIYIVFKGNPMKFRIIGRSYEAINPEYLMAELHTGDSIEIDLLANEINRNEKKMFMNLLFGSAKETQIYGLRKKNKSYLTLEKYNRAKRGFNADNFLWGIVFTIFIIIWMVWVLNQDDTLN